MGSHLTEGAQASPARDAVGWEDAAAGVGLPELSVQEAASCAVSPSLSPALPLRDVTVSGITPTLASEPPTPRTQLFPQDGLRGAVHARCLCLDAGRQRNTRSRISYLNDQRLCRGEPVPPQPVPRGCAGGTGRACTAPWLRQAHECPCSPFAMPLPGSHAPLRTITHATCCYGGRGPADRPAGLRRGRTQPTALAACLSLRLVPVFCKFPS